MSINVWTLTCQLEPQSSGAILDQWVIAPGYGNNVNIAAVTLSAADSLLLVCNGIVAGGNPIISSATLVATQVSMGSGT
jgi:hypothetical protein